MPLFRTTRLVEWLVPTRPEHAPEPWRRLWLLIVYTVRRWFSTDHCSSLASSLTLQTMLSVVPTVGVLMFFVKLAGETSEYTVVLTLTRAISPDESRAQDFAQTIVELGKNIDLAALGGWGFLTVIILAYLLFSTLERTVNSLWRVRKARNMVAKFTMFFTLAVLTPIIVVYSLAEPIFNSLGNLPMIPVLTTSVGLIAINAWLPNQPVSIRAAITGGLISAALFEFGKLGFGWYLKAYATATYEGIYGSIAVLPVFLAWSYVSWIIVLLGVEVAWVVHHLPAIEREGYVHPNDRGRDVLHAAPGRTASRLLLAIGDNYSRRHRGSTVTELNERFQIGLGPIVAITDRMCHLDLITPLEGGGYIPARPLDQIKLGALLENFDGGDLLSAREDSLAEVFVALDGLQTREIGELSFADLVDRERRRLPDAP